MRKNGIPNASACLGVEPIITVAAPHRRHRPSPSFPSLVLCFKSPTTQPNPLTRSLPISISFSMHEKLRVRYDARLSEIVGEKFCDDVVFMFSKLRVGVLKAQ